MNCDEDYLWKLMAGDDSTRVFEYQDSAGDAIDLTGYTAVATYDVGLVLGYGVATVDGPNGTVTVKFGDDQTIGFTGNGTFRLTITSPGGDKLTLVSGKLLVKTWPNA